MRAIVALHSSLLVLGLLGVAPDARAGWTVAGTVEYYAWRERTPSLPVKENGALAGARVGLSQLIGGPVHARYRGRIYAGAASYEGSKLLSPSVPASGTSQYFGTTQSAGLGCTVTDGFGVTLGMDLDLWRRRLSVNQAEDFRVLSWRAGVSFASPHIPWSAEAGVKSTVWTREDAHFDDLGFDQNPILEPGRSVTPYLEFGYAFARRWSLIGSFDGFRFGRSNEVTLAQGRTTITSHQPQSDMRVIGLSLQYH